jgi:hypothetical protein
MCPKPNQIQHAQVRTVSEAHVSVFRRLYFFLLWNNFLSTCVPDA